MGFTSFLLCFGLQFWSDFGDFWSPRVAIRTRLREHCGWRPPCFFYPKGAENSPKTCQEHAENQCRKQVPLNGDLSIFSCNLPSTVRLQPSLGAPTPICPTSKSGAAVSPLGGSDRISPWVLRSSWGPSVLWGPNKPRRSSLAPGVLMSPWGPNKPLEA